MVCVVLVVSFFLKTALVSGQAGKNEKVINYSLSQAGTPIDLFLSPRQTFLITTTGVYQQERKTFQKKYNSQAPITCALEEDSVLWLGTQKGLWRLNKKTFTARRVPLPSTEDQPLITTILKDYSGTLWAAAEAYGAFKLTAGTFKKVLGAFPVNTGVASRDSSVWIGTNTGLHRFKNEKWVRYNEEGVANFEIPDNIVEKLVVDSKDNVWVMLSEGVAVFEGRPHASESEGHNHIPSVKFVGKPQNKIYSVVYLNQQGYVFATAMGLLFLPDDASGHIPDLHPAANTDVIIPKPMLYPVQVPNISSTDFSGPVILKSDKKNNVWLVTGHGIRILPSKIISKMLGEVKTKKA